METPVMHWMGLAVSCPNGLRTLTEYHIGETAGCQSRAGRNVWKTGSPLHKSIISPLLGTQDQLTLSPEQSFRE